MKRLVILVLTLILLCSTAIAESAPSREFTIDEQAYDVYLDVSYVMDNTVKYLEELRRLWDIALHAESIEDVNNLDLIECISEDYLIALTNMYLTKYGYSDSEYKQRMFSGPNINFKEKTDLIWYYLALGIEAKYLVSMDSLKPYLDDAMSGIRIIMATDREYPFLKDLQNYYKETVLIHGYASDINDNYTEFDSKLDSYKTSRSSWSIDFEFIFDPNDYGYVYEIRRNEQQEEYSRLYNQAIALEKSENYEEAIALYWQCNSYNDSIERISFCHTAKNEYIYQLAIEKQHEGNYAEALSLLELIFHYKDSQEKYFLYSYQFASHLETQGCYQDAIKIYNTIPNYRDSKDRAEACQTWAFVEPYGIRLGTKLTIHDWGVGEVVRISDKIYTGTTTSSNGTKTHQYVQIWVNYPSKGEMWHHIPDHFEYGLKVVTSGN